MTYLLLAAAILIVHAADVIYTIWAMVEYDLYEANPLFKAISRDPHTFWTVSFMLMVGILVGLYYLHCPAWALGFGLAARVLVMIRNVNIVRAARRGHR